MHINGDLGQLGSGFQNRFVPQHGRHEKQIIRITLYLFLDSYIPLLVYHRVAFQMGDDLSIVIFGKSIELPKLRQILCPGITL